ncbi:MAG: hypothetical protein NTY75_00255 [Candidatus Shapirobacteria bacterium]|nr:hypothetical protein [Candidatus Shapirobacteria bacterium]
MENNDQIIKRIDTLYEGLLSAGDIKIYLMFLDKYLYYINKLPELSKRILSYSSEKNKYYDEIKKTDINLSTEVDREVLRISSNVSVNPKQIDKTILTDWGDQTDDIPRDGKSILEFYKKLEKGSGISRYLVLEEFVEYINSNNEEIYSFACGFDNLSIGEKCQDSYHKWIKKYYDLNPVGQIWWSYLHILAEKRKVPTKIDFLRLKKFVSALHNDIKQLLIVGDDWNKEIILLKPDDIREIGENDLGGYEIEIGNKCLNFEDITGYSCRGFRYFLQNYNKMIKNKEIVDYVNDPKLTEINKLITSLRDKFNDNGLGMRIELKPGFKDSERGYKMIINPKKTVDL